MGRPAMAVLMGAVAGVLAGERWAARTRATRAERRMPLPGDDLVAAPVWRATRAIGIGAPPEAVWPWLVQMGFPGQRAGWYTPHLLDRILFGIRTPSADRILPHLQGLAVGDRVSDSQAGHSYFTAAVVDAPTALVLHSRTHPMPMYRDVCFSWAFAARPEPDGTRLVMRARVTYTPVWPAALVRVLITAGFGVGDLIQAGGMLRGIRSRVEASRSRRAAPRTPTAP